MNPMSAVGWTAVVLIGSVTLSYPNANAQTPYLNLRGSNFDIWCQEHEQSPPERCDQRTQQDEKAYESYRDKIGDFEETLRLKRQSQDQMDKAFLHNDPIDNPHSQ